MSDLPADIVECWVFRVPDARPPEVLLMRRSEGRIFAGLWQPVTGRPEAGEIAPFTALREVSEETGLAGPDIEALYTLDQVVQLYSPRTNGIMHAVLFALRVRPSAAIRISHEHDAERWVPLEEAATVAVWPAYRESLARIERLAGEPGFARWFELDETGRRKAG